MVQKCVIIADPGIDTAFAIALALHDPNLDVLGLIATAGNVTAGQATQNVHVLINQIDPPRWPRLGAAAAGVSRARELWSGAHFELRDRRLDLGTLAPHTARLLEIGPAA